VIEGVQEFPTQQNLLSLYVVHRYLERALNGKVVGLEAGRNKSVSAHVPQTTGRNEEVETGDRRRNASRRSAQAVLNVRAKKCTGSASQPQLCSIDADGGNGSGRIAQAWPIIAPMAIAIDIKSRIECLRGASAPGENT